MKEFALKDYVANVTCPYCKSEGNVAALLNRVEAEGLPASMRTTSAACPPCRCGRPQSAATAAEG
jgi:hypothetical protein